MEMEVQTYLWVCLIVFFAALIRGFSGFGAIMFALPLLAIFLDIKTVIPLTALVGLSMTILLLINLRKYLEWKKIYTLLTGAVLGIPIGVFFLKKLDKDMIHWILGIILVSYSMYSLFFESSKRGIGKWWACLFGFLGGCLGGGLSASSPPIIVYASLQSWSKDEIKVILQEFFFVSGLIVVFAHAVSGVTTVAILRLYGISLPVLVLGMFIGAYFYGMIGEQWYKKVMFILLGLLGVFMIYKAI